jgi:hypothetical protein
MSSQRPASLRRQEHLLKKGPHCAVEWDEEGRPRGVVQTKNVSGIGKEDFNVGDMCNVRVQTGSKIANYTAELLATGNIFHTTMIKLASTHNIYYYFASRNPARDERLSK